MKKDVYNLTAPQNSIWLTEQFYQGTNINNICGSLTISEIVDFEKLSNAINIFVKNTDSFRLKFFMNNGIIKQYVSEYIPFNIEIIDVSSDDDVKNIERNIGSISFYLIDKLLFNFKLFKFPDGHGGFAINAHHIISDSWTLGILVNEIIKIYSCLLNNEDIDNSSNYSYIDYINSEQEYLQSNKYIKDKEYWDNIYSTVPEIATIPSINNENSKNASIKAERELVKISTNILNKINDFCTQNKVSVYNFFMAVYSIYLNRVSNLNDFVIGTPILNRTNFKEKHTAGMFINTIPLRITIDNNETFKNFVSKIAIDSMGMLRHQKYSYQYILENLRKQDSSLPNLYNIMLSYQVTKMTDNIDTIPHSTRWAFNETTADDIDIHLFEFNDASGLNIAYDYKVDKYSQNDINAMHERILHIINQIIDNNEISLNNIEIVTPEEKHKILYEFNNTTVDYPKDKTVIQLFEEQVEKTPDNIAVVFKDQKLTYKELNEKANQLAHYLIDNGVKNGEIISVCMNKNISFISTILGIQKCGCAYLPINPSYPLNRINYILENSKSKFIITESNLNTSFPNNINLSNLNLCYYNKDNLNINFTPNDLSYIIYTSGSTGTPKGVMLTHNNLVNFLYGFNNCFDKKFGINDNCLSLTNISFDVSVCEIFTPLVFGSTLVLYPEDTLTSIPTLCDILNKNNITFLYIPPSVLNEVSSFIINNKIKTYINKLLVGVESIKNYTLNKFLEINPDLEIINGYGPTEATICTTFYKYVFSKELNKTVPIGIPISNSNIFILDKNNNILPIGITGELCISGDNVSTGYLNNLELTNKSFIYDNKLSTTAIYKTGDLAYFTNDGNIIFLGRNDSQIKFKGHRIELSEINNTIIKNSNITNSYTLIKKINKIDSICSYITTNSNINIKEIYSYLNNNLPYYMIPSHIVILDTFPLTLNGKIDKTKLPDIKISTSVYEKITDETELELSKYICNILNISTINRNDNFFDLGLDSLTSIKLVTEIYNNFNINIPIRIIFENPNIKKLSSIIRNFNKTNIDIILKTEKQEYYPVSSAQKRVYYASSLDGDNSLLYNIAGGIVLDTKPDVSKLEQCFNTLINRHESLRTYFEVIDGNIVQKIIEKVKFKLNVQNSNTNNIDKLFNSFIKPFKLNKAPLFNAKLINLKNNKSLLLLNMHHIISDGTSLSVLTDELCKLYNNTEELPELSINYKDFAVWENNKINSDEFNKDKEFWVNQFKDEVPLLNMPTNYTRPTVQNFDGNSIYTTIDSNFTLKINELCKNLGITPYMFLLSVYYILLYKYTGQDDIVVGSPIVGRDNIQLSNIIGMFVNTLALRNKINSSLSFTEFVKVIKENCLKAFEHQTYPFNELINSLEIKRDTSRNPLFDTMFIYQNNGTATIDFDGIKAENYIPKSNISKFDLSLEVLPENDTLNLRFEYCTKLFNENFINRLSKHYINILQVILNNENIHIADIDMLSEEEKNQILYEFNNTTVEYAKDKTVIQLFEEQVQKNPNNTAIVFEDKKLTYKELNEKANQLANCLIEKNIQENSVVGIMLNRSLETIICMLAVLKANATYMLIDPNLPEDRILYMLNNANSPLLITSSNIKNISFNNILIIDKENFNNYNNNNLNLNYNINNSFCIIYTSGSTGIPKGVELKNISIINLVLNHKLVMNTDICNNFLSISTISFDMFMVESFVPLLSGKTIILSNTEEQKIPTSISNLIKKYKVDFILTTPSRMELLFINEDTKSCLQYLKVIQLGGEVFTSNLFEKIQKYTTAHVYNAYGPSETTACCTVKHIQSHSINIGKPLYNIKIYVLNSDLNICPVGIEGEICVSGDGISKGYINNPTATNKVFIKNPFGNGLLYKTGDIGKYNSKGELEYIGRKDFQVKMRGLRIELSEIEKQLLHIPQIKNCAIIYKELPENNSYLAAFFTSRITVDASYIREELAKHLPLYMVPKYIIQLKNLPITRNGKIDLNALKTYEISTQDTDNYTPPENELQKLFCDVWEKLLNTKVGINDDIFELGADSLLAIKFKVEMLSHNIDVQYSDIFKYPTVKGLSEVENINVSTQMDTYNYTEINKVLEKNDVKNIKNAQKCTHNNILLLGSNGYVGMHILYDFIKNDTGNIYCIIRDKNKISAKTRFLNTLHFYFNNELDEFIDNRIIVLTGDITKENFGLNTETFNSITNKISILINSSANVRHYGNLKDFENINIDLTKKTIDFCKKYNKRLIHISSTSVCGNINNNENITFSENNLYIGQELDNVYINSKFEAEKLILENFSTGLNAQILRLGNITNRYSDGKFQINPNENAFVGRLQSLIKLGIIPDYLLNTKLEFTPVDLCGNAIISIMQNYIPELSVFHLYNNYYITMKEFVEFLKQNNINLNIVSQDEFNKIVKETLLDENKKDILSGIINDLNINNKVEVYSEIDITSEFSRVFLNTLNFNWLKIDNVYIEKYINYLKYINFI